MRGWQDTFPPSSGEEPYLYFAFAEADSARVWPIMRLLLARGVRVWYCVGAAAGAEALLQRQARADGAALRLLYLTDAAVDDRDTKTMLLVSQKAGRPILCLDPDGTDRRLAMGLREDVPHLPLYEYRNNDELEEALIRSDGFTQALFGEPVAVEQTRWIGKLALVLSVLAAVMLLVSFVGYRYLDWFRPTFRDEIVLSDPVIQTAARHAAGGGAITEEKLAQIRMIRLPALPESWDDLELLPALERIELPQQALLGDGLLPDGDYVIELSGGGAA